MTFSTKTLLMTAVLVAVSVVSVSSASACGRRGYSRGYSSYQRVSYGYHRPAYSYAQPSPVIRHVQPVQAIPPVPQPGVPMQAGQPIPQPGIPVQAGQPQLVPQQTVGTPNPQSLPSVQPQQVSNGQLAPVQPPQQNTAVQPQQPAAAPSGTTAQISALQALGGFAPPAAPQPAPSQVQTPAHVGTWTASLGNGARVQLVLNADGSFTWSATNQTGSASSFSGTYTVGNGTLNLIRSNDNQTLSGSMTLNGSTAFGFKVTGTNAATINFTRS